jgi:hypothetical protein
VPYLARQGSKTMKEKGKAASMPPGYFLSEEHQQQLEALRDHMYLMMDFVLATTQVEDDEPLRLQRSRLGKMFELFGTQLDQVLDGLQQTTLH